MKTVWLLMLLVVLPSLETVVAQSEYTRFKRLTIGEGLSLSSVYCIHQDEKGFMWFGTEDGLNKYDGEQFKIYYPESNNPNSLVHKWTESIIYDSAGSIWFGSRGGLTRFDPRKDQFTQYTAKKSKEHCLTNDTITALCTDSEGYIWVGTRKGINRIHILSGNIKNVQLSSGKLPGFKVNDILSDAAGTIWIATNDGLFRFNQELKSISKAKTGYLSLKKDEILSLVEKNNVLWLASEEKIIYFEPATGKTILYPFPSPKKNDKTSVTIEKLFTDKNDAIWITSSIGLHKLIENENLFLHVVKTQDVSHSLSLLGKKPILQGSDGYIWFGTFGSGIYKIDPVTLSYTLHKHNPADPHSLSENSINAIYEDHFGQIWIGTFGAGISIYDPGIQKFGLLRHDPLNKNSLSSNFIWTVCEAHDGSVWIGTNDKGICRYIPKQDTFITYDHNPAAKGTLSGSSVRCIFEDRKNNIWAGTDGEGLNIYNARNDSFSAYQHDPDDTSTISDNSVRVLMEDHHGNLWIGTRNGLNKLDPQSMIFTRYKNIPGDTTSLSHNFIYSAIMEDSSGKLWIGTYGGGLNQLDPGTMRFTRFLHDPDNPKSLSDNIVFSVYEQSNEVLWVGTNDGLNRYDRRKGIFTHYGLDEGLPNEVIYSILPGPGNNLWLSTNRGICCFNTQSNKTVNYYVQDGLQSNEFNGGAFHLGKSEKMYFGGVYGVNIIDPFNIKPDDNAIPMVITHMEIMGLPVKTDTKLSSNSPALRQKDNYYLPVNIVYAKKITLDDKEKVFSIGFAAINHPKPENIKYYYRMEGLEDDWINAGNRNYVSYANMRQGSYAFHVNYKGPEGTWSKNPVALQIKILPPFWLKWWFILFEIIVALVIALLIHYYLLKLRTNKLLKEQNRQINLANKKLSDSEQKLMKLNATKDVFFSIIAHDLKNPFASLYSIVHSMQSNFKSLEEGERISGMEIIHESVNNIQSLLENLLTWSRSQTKRIQYNPVNFNLTEVIQVNINLFRTTAVKKNIKINYSTDKTARAFGDREMINTVIRNLVHNAIKFSYPGGKINIEVDTNQHMLEVRISDEGVGILPDDIEKLFRIDVKFKSTGTQGEKGTGLGLVICNDFMEKNGGNLKVISEPGKGSTFGINIPFEKKHLSPER